MKKLMDSAGRAPQKVGGILRFHRETENSRGARPMLRKILHSYTTPLSLLMNGRSQAIAPDFPQPVTCLIRRLSLSVVNVS